MQHPFADFVLIHDNLGSCRQINGYVSDHRRYGHLFSTRTKLIEVLVMSKGGLNIIRDLQAKLQNKGYFTSKEACFKALEEWSEEYPKVDLGEEIDFTKQEMDAILEHFLQDFRRLARTILKKVAQQGGFRKAFVYLLGNTLRYPYLINRVKSQLHHAVSDAQTEGCDITIVKAKVKK